MNTKTLLVIIRPPESKECLDAAIKVLRDGGCGVEIGKEEQIAEYDKNTGEASSENACADSGSENTGDQEKEADKES